LLLRFTLLTFQLAPMINGDATRQGVLSQMLAAISNERETGAVAGCIAAWEQLIEQLSPLIGEVGLCALFARARHLANPAIHPTPTSGEMRSSAILVEQLEAQLGSMDEAAALAYNAVLLDTFTKLLSGLIGEALTARLLNTAWAARPDGKRT
jgi:hypothetical protein